MARQGLLGDRQAGEVTLVEAPVSRSYARKAWIAFYVVGVTVNVLTAVAVSTVAHIATAVVGGAVAGVACGLLVAMVVRAWPVLRALWHWAAEIVLASVALVTVARLALATHPLVALGAALALAVVLGGPSPVRRRFLALVWCAVVRHRLRLCFAEFIRAANRVRPGSGPLILLARPTPAGERVWVWLRPGLDLAELESKTDKVAVACWAGEARVVRASTRFAALLRVDVTRRDPLAVEVSSPLLRLVPASVTVETPLLSVLPPSGLDLPDVPEVMAEPVRSRR